MTKVRLSETLTDQVKLAIAQLECSVSHIFTYNVTLITLCITFSYIIGNFLAGRE
ncbi:hypothetical protein LC605_30295 [Nostoc sp. CHAB 5836]|nr:hypothetical protein [Nostoc sp. CHAB 5836]